MIKATCDRLQPETKPAPEPGIAIPNEDADRDSQRPSRARVRAALSAGSIVTLLAAGAWLWQADLLQPPPTTSNLSAAATAQLLRLEPQAVSTQLDVAGTISAGKSVAIVAPFDGVIREKLVQLGDYVGAGAVLVVMDTGEIASRFRDAQAAYLKAAMAMQALEKWESGPDVLRAKRSLEAAETLLGSLERQLAELKRLLDQGIISRNEYEGAVQQRDAQRDLVASAKDELNSTLRRGNADNRQLLALELENAQGRLWDLKAQISGANVATAVPGILTKPPATSNGLQPISIEPGASVTRGTALFSIADTSSFTVTGSIDEVDVNQVKLGQPVTIVSDALPGSVLEGRIVSVSAEASVGRSAATGAEFEVRASFAVDDVLRKVIRIGMSARMTVETYSNPAALIVPPSAIADTASGRQVRVTRNGSDLSVPVLLGKTFPLGVEVLSGLITGDEVHLR